MVAVTGEATATIELSREHGGYQIAIYGPRGFGYRIAGPKFSGTAQTLESHTLTQRDADEIRSVLNEAFPPATDMSSDTPSEVVR